MSPKREARRPVRILVADDHQVVREGLRRMLEVEGRVRVVGEVGTGGAELQEALRARPDILLLGLKTRQPGVAEAVRQIREKAPGTRVLVLTLGGEQGLAEAIGAGAVGYLLKEAGREEMLRAIDLAAKGEPCPDPSLGRQISIQFASLAQGQLGLGLSAIPSWRGQKSVPPSQTAGRPAPLHFALSPRAQERKAKGYPARRAQPEISEGPAS